MLISPMTELEAVNTMLSIIGESPVSTLEDSGLVDAVTALMILRSVSREVQSQGWHWNTDKGVKITPSFPDKFLFVPQNTLRVDTVGSSQDLDVAQRGLRLWDRRKHTFTFSQTATVDLTLGLSFDDLPEPARQYITIRAARTFQERVLGSEVLASFGDNDEFQARANLLEDETDSADYNLMNNWAVARILQR